MNILYITFGDNISNHLQAAFSICSFLAAPQPPHSITVYTDVPGFYTHLQPKVNIVPLTVQQLQDWRGPHDFFWRIKIKAIQLFAEQHGGKPILYLDTDTFLYSHTALLTAPLAAGNALMHIDEGRLGDIKGKTTRIMWQDLKQKTFAGILMEDRYHMWNAGVVASPNTKGGKEFVQAVQLCDEMCAAKIRPRLLEQYALSVALEHAYGLQPAVGAIAHYWSTKKEWNEFITAFFLTTSFHTYSLEQTVQHFQQLDLCTIPIGKKVKSTSAKLHKLVNKLYKEEPTEFVKKQHYEERNR